MDKYLKLWKKVNDVRNGAGEKRNPAQSLEQVTNVQLRSLHYRICFACSAMMFLFLDELCNDDVLDYPAYIACTAVTVIFLDEIVTEVITITVLDCCIYSVYTYCAGLFNFFRFKVCN